MEAILCARAPAASPRHQAGLATQRELQVGLTTLQELRQAGLARGLPGRFNNTTRDLFAFSLWAYVSMAVHGQYCYW